MTTKNAAPKPAPTDTTQSTAGSASHTPIIAALDNLKISDATSLLREPAVSSSLKNPHVSNPIAPAVVATESALRSEQLEPAMRAYIQAVSDERVGNLSAAIRGYREGENHFPW